jgi:prepilin-type N-terminal cleavage/methylation domain-containing protein
MKFKYSRKKHSGFTIIELMIVVALIGVLGALLMPRISNLMVSLRVPAVAEDLNKYVSLKKGTSDMSDGEPYTGLTQTSFARAMLNTNLKATKGSDIVMHKLGGLLGGTGTVTIFETGNQFGFTMPGLSKGACPDLLNQMQINAGKVTLNGTTVKQTDDSGNVSTPYNVNTAESACVDSDTNEAVFTYN